MVSSERGRHAFAAAIGEEFDRHVAMISSRDVLGTGTLGAPLADF